MDGRICEPCSVESIEDMYRSSDSEEDSEQESDSDRDSVFFDVRACRSLSEHYLLEPRLLSSLLEYPYQLSAEDFGSSRRQMSPGGDMGQQGSQFCRYSDERRASRRVRQPRGGMYLADYILGQPAPLHFDPPPTHGVRSLELQTAIANLRRISPCAPSNNHPSEVGHPPPAPPRRLPPLEPYEQSRRPQLSPRGQLQQLRSNLRAVSVTTTTTTGDHRHIPSAHSDYDSRQTPLSPRGQIRQVRRNLRSVPGIAAPRTELGDPGGERPPPRQRPSGQLSPRKEYLQVRNNLRPIPPGIRNSLAVCGSHQLGTTFLTWVAQRCPDVP